MKTATLLRTTGWLFLRRTRAALGAVVEGLQRRRLQRATHMALSGLSAHILRDIGIDPSEIPSIAHAAPKGDPTRIHLMQPVHPPGGRLTHGDKP